MKKIFVCVVVLLFVLPNFASAASMAELQVQIASLLQIVYQLQTQLLAIKNKSTTSIEANKTIIPIQNIPTITNIQSVTNSPGVVDSGKKASIYGTGLSGFLTIKIGSQESQYVYANGSDTYAEFIAPIYSMSRYVSVTVTNSSGLVSNTYQLYVNVPTPQASSKPYIKGFSPSYLVPGSTVSVYGGGFDSTTFVSVDSGSWVLYPSVQSSDTLTFTLPSSILTGIHSFEIGNKGSAYSNTDKIYFVVSQ